MKRLAILAMMLTGLTAFGQLPSRVLTSPTMPTKEALDRLNLQVGWRTLLPVESRRDGIAHVQHLGSEIFVQLRNGEIYCIEPETGSIRWSRRIGNRYPVARRLGIGRDVVFALDGNRVLALDRANGSQRWDLELHELPLAPPMAGELLLYVPFSNGRIQTFALPETFAKAQKLDTAERKKARQSLQDFRTNLRKSEAGSSTGSDPRYTGGDSLRGRSSSPTNFQQRIGTSMSEVTASRGEARRLIQPGAETPDRPVLVGFNSPGFRTEFPVNVNAVGVLVTGMEKDAMLLRRDPENPIFRFTTDAPMTFPPVDFGPTAYVTSSDSTVQSVDLVAGLINWRFATGSPMIEPPVVTDDSVYLQTAFRGLFRVDRKTGAAIWVQPEASRFHATNSKFVYANDRLGKLIVLDRNTGEILSRYDLSPFNVVFANHRTDRVLLVANDGSIISLHDQSQAKPMIHRPDVSLPQRPAEKKPADEVPK